MKGPSRTVVYFNEPAPDHTGEVMEIVCRRTKDGDIRSVVVAGSSAFSLQSLSREC